MFCLATLPEDGMIRYRGAWDRERVHHRESFVPVEVADYDSLTEAKQQLGTEPDQFLLEFNKDRVCVALWFPKEFKEEGTRRLQRWRGCYGSYDVRRIR